MTAQSSEIGQFHPLLEPIQRLHRLIRDEVVIACERASVVEMSGVAADAEGDTIYAVDRVAERLVVPFLSRTIATPQAPVLLVAEGISGGELLLPSGSDRSAATWVVIVDPVDGTRGLMYQKRPAWILTGVAPGPGPSSLAKIELAVQTEIPLVKQHLSDELWAVRGKGMAARRVNRVSITSEPLHLHPSKSTTIAHGFATVSRFFPGRWGKLAGLDDELVVSVLGPAPPGKAHLFEDQYISSAGQLYELMAGHDRFVADLRGLVDQGPHGGGLCSHPYDLCTELIARECGVTVVDVFGRPLDAPLDITTDMSWIGYANSEIRSTLEPVLQRVLAARGLLQ